MKPTSESLTIQHMLSRSELSLCMIVRDEAARLDAALASIRPWVDEMIVVDTGSTDNTVEIAQHNGAKVHHFAWCDDFAAARNESLRHAKGRWLFWMDADDTIDEVNGSKLQALARREVQTEVFGYIFELRFPGRRGSGDINLTVVEHLRLFRNLPQVRFEGRVHEQILPSIQRAGGKVERSDIFLVHTNYDFSPEGQAKKRDRNLRLVALDLAERPDDPFVLFNAGMVHFMVGDYATAIDALTKSAVLSQPDRPHTRKAYSLLCMAFMRNGQHEAAWSVCRNGRRLVPDDAELLFLEGELLQHFQKFRAAEAAFRTLLTQPRGSYLAGFDPSIQGFRARHHLAAVLAQQNHCDEAASHWRQVVQEVPAFTPAWQGLLDLMLRPDRPQWIQEMTDRMLEVPHAGGLARVWRSRLALKENDHATAYRELKAAAEEHPQDPLVLDEFCKFLFQHGSVEEAEQYLKRFQELQPENANIYLNLGALCFGQQRYEEASRWLTQALKHNPRSAEAYLYQGETLHQLGRSAEARQSWSDAARLAGEGSIREQALQRLRNASPAEA